MSHAKNFTRHVIFFDASRNFLRYGEHPAFSEVLFKAKRIPDGADIRSQEMISYHYSLEKMHKTRQPDFVKKWAVGFYVMMVLTVVYVFS